MEPHRVVLRHEGWIHGNAHPHRLSLVPQIDHLNPASFRIRHRKAAGELPALHTHGQAAITGIPRRSSEKLTQGRLHSRLLPPIPIHADQQTGYVRIGGDQCKLLDQPGSGQRQYLNRFAWKNRRLRKPFVRAECFPSLIQRSVRFCQGNHAIPAETLLIGRHDCVWRKQGIGEVIVSAPFRSKLHPAPLLKRNGNEAVASP